MINKHIIGIGGTGAKCVEAIIHLTVCGMIPPSYVSLFDQDQNNGNLTATKHLLERHAGLVKSLGKQLYRISPNSQLFRNELTCPPGATHWCWQPFGRQSAPRLDTMFKFASLDENLRHLATCLFNFEHELSMDLTQGFRGRPAVGAAVISGSRDEEHLFWSYVEHMLESATGNIDVFLAGSVFGGTGAAGLPTIARQIKHIENGGGESRLAVGAAMMLPYFSYVDSTDKKEKLRVALSSGLPLRSQLALDFYARTLGASPESFFDTAYILGLPKLLDLDYMSAGGVDQCNPAMIPELYAGLAAGHFLRVDKGMRDKLYLCGVSSSSTEDRLEVRWRDLPSPLTDQPKDSVRARLGRLARFAFAYYYVYHPYLFPPGEDSQRIGKICPESWYKNLMAKDGRFITLHEVPEAEPLNEYCMCFLKWYAALGLTSRKPEDINLAPMMRIKYADLPDEDGEPRTLAPKVKLLPPPTSINDKNIRNLETAFAELLGDGGVGGLDVIYEGLCRQQRSKEHGFAVFVDALWRACALEPSAE